MNNFTFLTVQQIYGNNQLDILRKYGTRCAITDFSILLGGEVSNKYHTNDGNLLENRAVHFWWTKTPLNCGNHVYVVNSARAVRKSIDIEWRSMVERYGGARPTLPYSSIFSIAQNGARDKNGILEVEYGEYPQTIVSAGFAEILEREYLNYKINKTGKCYTTDSVNIRDEKTLFRARTYEEYEYKGKKYIRFVADSNCSGKVLSDCRVVKAGSPYWIEVEPIKWLIDEKTDIALCKKIIFSGVQFHRGLYSGDLSETDIKKFMDKYFSKDIIPSKIKSSSEEETKEIITTENIIEQEQSTEFYENNKDERLKKINDAKMRIMALSVDEEIKNTMFEILDDLICSIEVKEKIK